MADTSPLLTNANRIDQRERGGALDAAEDPANDPAATDWWMATMPDAAGRSIDTRPALGEARSSLGDASRSCAADADGWCVPTCGARGESRTPEIVDLLNRPAPSFSQTATTASRVCAG